MWSRHVQWVTRIHSRDEMITHVREQISGGVLDSWSRDMPSLVPMIGDAHWVRAGSEALGTRTDQRPLPSETPVSPSQSRKHHHPKATNAKLTPRRSAVHGLGNPRPPSPITEPPSKPSTKFKLPPGNCTPLGPARSTTLLRPTVHTSDTLVPEESALCPQARPCSRLHSFLSSTPVGAVPPAAWGALSPGSPFPRTSVHPGRVGRPRQAAASVAMCTLLLCPKRPAPQK